MDTLLTFGNISPFINVFFNVSNNPKKHLKCCLIAARQRIICISWSPPSIYVLRQATDLSAHHSYFFGPELLTIKNGFKPTIDYGIMILNNQGLVLRCDLLLHRTRNSPSTFWPGGVRPQVKIFIFWFLPRSYWISHIMISDSALLLLSTLSGFHRLNLLFSMT